MIILEALEIREIKQAMSKADGRHNNFEIGCLFNDNKRQDNIKKHTSKKLNPEQDLSIIISKAEKTYPSSGEK